MKRTKYVMFMQANAKIQDIMEFFNVSRESDLHPNAVFPKIWNTWPANSTLSQAERHSDH